MVLSPRQATLAPWREVVLGEARGKIAANSVTPYPPGIPLLVPGEEISDESIEYLRGCWQRGIEIRGWAHPDRKTIWVVDDD